MTKNNVIPKLGTGSCVLSFYSRKITGNHQMILIRTKISYFKFLET